VASASGRAQDKGSNMKHSHLYASTEMQIGTWQRIDIPKLPELQQYDYVLFTDADVYFRRRVTLEDFGLPLPEAVGMGYEMVSSSSSLFSSYFLTRGRWLVCRPPKLPPQSDALCTSHCQHSVMTLRQGILPQQSDTFSVSILSNSAARVCCHRACAAEPFPCALCLEGLL
jgi:hypothetical protein